MPDSATTAPGQVSLSVAWHCGPLGQFEVITRQLITTFLPFDTGRLLNQPICVEWWWTMLYNVIQVFEVYFKYN